VQETLKTSQTTLEIIICFGPLYFSLLDAEMRGERERERKRRRTGYKESPDRQREVHPKQWNSPFEAYPQRQNR
jgi:hypothetical protein